MSEDEKKRPSRRRTYVLLAVLFVMVLAGAAIFVVCVVLPSRGPPGIPPELVPAEWAQFRTSAGHVEHVDQKTIACKECHDYEHDGFKNPGVAPCAKCHAKESSHTHVGDAEKKTDCLTCHAFAPKSPQKPDAACIGCHSISDGPLAAIKTHAQTDCASCHHPHEEPSIAPKPCVTCHKEIAQKHAEHGGGKGCSDCHTPHAPAIDAVKACVTCHKAEAQGSQPASHTCASCHKPHDFATTAPGGASVCASCHGDKLTLVATRVPQHAVCTSCHAAHEPNKAAESCTKCHNGIQVSHANKLACITCHAPHAKDIAAASIVAAPCTTCHASVATDLAAHSGKLACENCHKPHDFTAPTMAANKKVLCASCHQKETTLTASSPGHAACATCHGGSTHRPAKGPACVTCHAKEQASAPKGHQNCLGCHEQHSGKLNATSSCTTCHANKAGGPHTSAGVASEHGTKEHAAQVQGCVTCHRAHGPAGMASPPACVSCHARDKLPALHSVSGHDACTNCHTSHGPPRADRATCTSTCHVDRRTHQPQVQVCSGCHVFRR